MSAILDFGCNFFVWFVKQPILFFWFGFLGYLVISRFVDMLKPFDYYDEDYDEVEEEENED